MSRPEDQSALQQALRRLVQPEDRLGLGVVLTWGEHALATDGVGALVAFGLGEEGERPCPDYVAEVLEGTGFLATLPPVEWPDHPALIHTPPKACAGCDGKRSEVCLDCGGDGRCHHCETGECDACGGEGRFTCASCDGTGEPGPRQFGFAPVVIHVGGGKATFNAPRLAADLDGLTPTGAKLTQQGARDHLLLSGDSWAYVMVGMARDLVPREPAAGEITLAPPAGEGHPA